jgi:hypothetical protein
VVFGACDNPTDSSFAHKQHRLHQKSSTTTSPTLTLLSQYLRSETFLKGKLSDQTVEVWRRAVLCGAGVPTHQLKNNAMCFVGFDATCADIVKDWIIGGCPDGALSVFEDPAYVGSEASAMRLPVCGGGGPHECIGGDPPNPPCGRRGRTGGVRAPQSSLGSCGVK